MVRDCYSYLKAIFYNRKAQGIIEYALILAFVVIIVIALYYIIDIDEQGRPFLKSLLLRLKDTLYHVSNMMENVSLKI